LSRKERHYEDLQTEKAVEKMRLSLWGEFDNHDVVVSANVDEVMSRSALQTLRWCQLQGPGPFTGALWMPMGRLDRALRTEFAVKGRPHTFAQPTIYRWGEILSKRQDGTRAVMALRVTNTPPPPVYYIAGGIHMTATSFLPNTLLKDLTATEYSGLVDLKMLLQLSPHELDNLQTETFSLSWQAGWLDRLDPLDQALDLKPEVPWFLKCNPDRFPYWHNRSDPRNLQLWEALQEYRRSEANGNLNEAGLTSKLLL